MHGLAERCEKGERGEVEHQQTQQLQYLPGKCRWDCVDIRVLAVVNVQSIDDL